MNESSLRVIADATPEQPEPTDLGLLPTTGSLIPVAVEPVKVLGHGRAAEARLVRTTTLDGESFLCVEKVFSPGWLTRAIYRVAFQAPFAYQRNADAIVASFYRRRVAASIIATMVPEAHVARPLYVRWDAASQAMVLASEYIRGRGIIPAPTDPRMLRRRWFSSMRRSHADDAPPREEINELLTLMGRLERLLVDCGLTGSGWQVCQRAIVSTANLLRTRAGYVVVDLESGIPSVLVSSYILAGVRLKTFPLFDDIDAHRLRDWIDRHQSLLAKRLGDQHHAQLADDVERLVQHTEHWKRSEPALGRRPWRLVGRDFRERFTAQAFVDWQRRDIVDQPTLAALRAGSQWTMLVMLLLGCVPSVFGRVLQRMWGHAGFRARTRRWLSDREYRCHTVQQFTQRKTTQWHIAGRVPATRSFSTIGSRFIMNYALSKTTPARMHRLLVDPLDRRNQRTRVFLLLVSGAFQSEFGRLLIQSRIEHWRRHERLTEEEANALTAQLNSPAVDEYVRCFGLHLGLKLLLPFVMSLKVGGAAASVASGNPLFFLFTLMLLPMLRTAVTLWRMLVSRRPLAEYRDALVVGMIPMVGSLAYPAQMYSRFTQLSLFLLRDFAARVGCWLPVYGGKDSRVELAAIKSVNLVAEAIECWLTLIGSRRVALETIEQESDATLSVLKIDRWSRLVHAQLSQLRAEAGLIDEDVATEKCTEARRAA